MASGRPPFSFLLIDLPSDHEIDNNLATECQVISAILHNREFGSIIKPVRATSVRSFNQASWHPYQKVGFVHLSAHGGPKGIELIGGSVKWADVARKIKLVAPLLKNGSQRVLSLSCCYSEDGYKALRSPLKGHFTGIYHFRKKKIGFATAITVWSMFYNKKKINRPALKVVEPINTFFEDDVIVYRDV